MAILQPDKVRGILNADGNASTLGNADKNITIVASRNMIGVVDITQECKSKKSPRKYKLVGQEHWS